MINAVGIFLDLSDRSAKNNACTSRKKMIKMEGRVFIYISHHISYTYKGLGWFIGFSLINEYEHEHTKMALDELIGKE